MKSNSVCFWTEKYCNTQHFDYTPYRPKVDGLMGLVVQTDYLFTECGIIKLWRVSAQAAPMFRGIYCGCNTIADSLLHRRIRNNLAFCKNPPKQQRKTVMPRKEYQRVIRKEPKHG